MDDRLLKAPRKLRMKTTMYQKLQRVHFVPILMANIEGRGANARIEVNFAEGSKWLVLQYANLQAL